MLVAGNWKMYKGRTRRASSPRRSAGSPSASGRRRRRLALPTSRSRDPAGAGRRAPSACTPRTSTGSSRGVHRRDSGADARGARRQERSSGTRSAGSCSARRTKRSGGVRRQRRAGLRVIACVGETEAEREAGDRGRARAPARPASASRAARDRVRAGLGDRYGRTATPEIAQEAHAFVKSLHDAPVLYGGSVKPDNAAVLLALPDVDGALVGGASLDTDSFASICRAGAEAVA